ncbi:MAG TPA: HPF/RaiA family ribosome-associated protein [Bryobacteraceae bacterium]|jgi:ribosome hibernation promoting factor|nr:HPF/RaiA family ribosome-associated protein [Bryobacteraceae bacterium]
MKIAYTGRLEKVDPLSQKKLDARVAKLSKLLDGNSEKEAHVIFTRQRHTHQAEITVNYYDHPLVGVGEASEKLPALMMAVDKLEKQLVKHRTKWRDAKRNGAGSLKNGLPAAESAPVTEEAEAPRINRVRLTRKPMSAEEAMMEMNAKKNYIAFRDSDSGGVSILIRRADGHFDLVEA